jgi:pimeloyl-ACP methyl ester carboxylesterase
MSVLEQVLHYPSLGCALPTGQFVRYREKAGEGTPVVLLHGIGSGSGSWISQLSSNTDQRLLAWDAPGYADSTALQLDRPAAADYARVLATWLGELHIEKLHLVGHSLGCLISAAFARLYPQQVKSLLLLAPAQGYGSASVDIQEAKAQERIAAVAQLGMQAMAEQRAPRLVSSAASAAQLELAKHMMSRLNPAGYTQATWMLSGANIRADLKAVQTAQPQLPIRIACGSQDIITPPSACESLAEFLHVPYIKLAGAGHLCAIESAHAVNELLKGQAHE